MIVQADQLEAGAYDVAPMYACTACGTWFPETARARHARRCAKRSTEGTQRCEAEGTT